MYHVPKLIAVPMSRLLLVSILLLAFEARAQEAFTVYLDSTAQTIRGFGAANIVGWRPDMTEAEIETAFGTDEGELGFSLLRLRIPPDEDQWAINLPTAQAARSMGVHVIASPWTPPASMKTNGDLVGGRLRDDMYDDYAAYLDAFATYMAANGADLYAVSVQNEPDIEVEYESSDWTPEEMRRFLSEHASAIGTRVIAPESYNFDHSMSDPALRDPAAAVHLDIVGGHIYGGGLAPYPLADSLGKELWMTEHLDLETDLSANIGTAVDIQRVMQAGMSAYLWWYIVRFYGPISDGEEGPYAKGEVTKRGYVMSQFSRFIRPGYIRVHTSPPGPFSNVLTTAYKDGSRLVVVTVNDSASPQAISLDLAGGSAEVFRRYVTSATHEAERLDDVQASGDGVAVTLEPHSVTTFVSEYVAVSTEEAEEDIIALGPNAPNPFGERPTTLAFTLTSTEHVTLSVYNALGQQVATLVDGVRLAGRHTVTFDGARLPSGVYVYRLTAGAHTAQRRMTLVR